MSGFGRIVVVLATVASVVSLTGCAASTGSPLSAAEKSKLRSDFIDSQWAPVRAEYSDAIRPSVPVTTVVSDRDWATDIAGCLRNLGFVVTIAGNGERYSYGSSSGETPLEYAVDSYSCSARYMSLSQLEPLLDAKSFLSLRRYNVGFVHACLVAAGQDSPLPQQGDPSALGDDSVPLWNPWQALKLGARSGNLLGYLEERCPPVPLWLNLIS